MSPPVSGLSHPPPLLSTPKQLAPKKTTPTSVQMPQLHKLQAHAPPAKSTSKDSSQK